MKVVASCTKSFFDIVLVICGFLPSARPGVGGTNSIRQGQSNLLERSWKLKVKI